MAAEGEALNHRYVGSHVGSFSRDCASLNADRFEAQAAGRFREASGIREGEEGEEGGGVGGAVWEVGISVKMGEVPM